MPLDRSRCTSSGKSARRGCGAWGDVPVGRAEHTQDGPQIIQGGAGFGGDLGERGRRVVGHRTQLIGRGRGADRDQRHVMGDHVMQFTGDLGPTAGDRRRARAGRASVRRPASVVALTPDVTAGSSAPPHASSTANASVIGASHGRRVDRGRDEHRRQYRRLGQRQAGRSACERRNSNGHAASASSHADHRGRWPRQPSPDDERRVRDQDEQRQEQRVATDRAPAGAPSPPLPG